jgi:PLD-like domain
MSARKHLPRHTKKPQKGATASKPAQKNLYEYERDTAKFQEILKVIDANMPQLRKAGVLFARPGYEQVGGLMSTRPAVVVTVGKKRNVAPSQQLPATLGGFPVDVRQSTFLERIRAEDPARYAQLVSAGKDEVSVPRPEQERIIATGQTDAGLLDAAVAARTPKEELDYSAPAGFPLDPIEAPMAITCHVSPDAGWLQLKAFFSKIHSKLVAGMYDFTSAHILQDLQSALRSSNASFTLTLDDPPAENATADQSDPDTVSSLRDSLGSNFQEAWALARSNRMVDKWIYPSAYHIKVAVSDAASTWLSSGNWNNSNQPDIDPWKDRTGADEVAKNSDRDWHVIIDNPKVSELFEAYLKNDYQVAAGAAGDQAAAAVGLEALAQLTDAEVQAIDAEMAVSALAPERYFEPLRIPSAGTRKIRIQPLLTPDKGSYASHVLKILQQAQQRLFIQLQYVHPSDNAENQDFIDLINTTIERQRNGIDVKIILSQWQLQQGWLDRFIQTGIDPNSIRIQHGVHNKGFVIDSQIVMLGSQNWSGQGVLQNRDASVIIYNQEAAQYYETVFQHDWENLAQPTSVISSTRSRRRASPAAALGAPSSKPTRRRLRRR